MIKYKCLSWNKTYSSRVNEESKKKLKGTSNFSNNYINKFILVLRKGAYPYEYMGDLEKFKETELLKKEKFYSN